MCNLTANSKIIFKLYKNGSTMRALAKAFDVSYSAMRSFLEREGVKTLQGKKTLELIETDKNSLLWNKILGIDRLIAELDKVCVNRYRINGPYDTKK